MAERRDHQLLWTFDFVEVRGSKGEFDVYPCWLPHQWPCQWHQGQGQGQSCQETLVGRSLLQHVLLAEADQGGLRQGQAGQVDQKGNIRPNASVHSMLIPCLRKFDLFSKDVILIPINHNNSHWTAAAINFRRKRIESYDSMGMARSSVHKVLPALLFSLWDWTQPFPRRCASTWTTNTFTRRRNRSILRIGSTG